jgi:hypothetical protein
MTKTLPPHRDRLICSNCGARTSYPTNETCDQVMVRGGVLVAFCDYCEVILGCVDGGTLFIFGPIPVEFPFVTGLNLNSVQ